jgi:hypothetical protein
MLTAKEFGVLGLSAVLMALMISFFDNTMHPELLIQALGFSIIIIFIWIFTKKFTADYLDISIEQKIWPFRRYWVSTASHFKRSLPVGIILPLLLSFLSAGAIRFFAFTTFYSKALPSKVSKKYGGRRFSNINEWDDSLIAFYGVISIMVLAIIARFTILPGFEGFSRIALYFAISNMIPFSTLDGMRIFMGSKPLYIFALVLLIATALLVLL